MKEEDDLPPDWDPGPPLPELAELGEPPSESFVDRVRSSIERKVTSGNLLDFSVPMLLDFLREMGALVFGITAPGDDRARKEKRDE